MRRRRGTGTRYQTVLLEKSAAYVSSLRVYHALLRLPDVYYGHTTAEPANLPESQEPGFVTIVSFVSKRIKSQEFDPVDNRPSHFHGELIAYSLPPVELNQKRWA